MQGIRIDRRRLIFKYILPPVIMILLILLDQIVKTLVETNFELYERSYVIKNFFYITRVHNEGAAFSFLSGKSWAQTFFICLTAVALVLFFIYYIYICSTNYRWLRYAMVFIIAGTIGNFIDRIAFKYVVDMIGFIFFGNEFAVFNLADAFMVTGICMLFIHYLFLDKNALFRSRKKKTDENDKKVEEKETKNENDKL